MLNIVLKIDYHVTSLFASDFNCPSRYLCFFILTFVDECFDYAYTNHGTQSNQNKEKRTTYYGSYYFAITFLT